MAAGAGAFSFLQRNRLRAQDRVFIDDSEANVDAAAAPGFGVIHFTAPISLRRQLEARGLLG